MATPSVNIVIPQGANFSEVFTSTETDGTATNLAGYSGSAKIKKFPSSNSSTSFNVGITSAVGEVAIALTSGKTTSIKPGRYYYDVVLTSSTGLVSRMVEGMALVTAGITT